MSFFTNERRAVRVANFRAEWYWIGTLGWILWSISPLGSGWLTSRVFRTLETSGVTVRFWFLVAGLLSAQLGAALLIYAAHRIYIPGVEAGKALIRANVVNAQTVSGGPEAAPRTVPVGDVLTRLRDDPFDVLFLLDNWIDMVGSTLFSVGAVAVMATIDPLATFAGVVPMLAIGFANRMVGTQARRYRQRSRAAASSVGDFLTASFQASLTVKVAGAQKDVLTRFDELSAERAKNAVHDDTWGECLWTLNQAAADLCVGFALLVAARGAQTTEEITLFVSYLAGMVWLPQRVGNILVGRRRFQVSAQRLDELVGPRTVTDDHLVTHRPMPILQPILLRTLSPTLTSTYVAPTRQYVDRTPLDELVVSNVTIAARGLVDVNLTLSRGSLTIISGPVGSGKTSLLRAIIGLLEADSGEVRWNGDVIADRAAFFVPPQCAYVSQVPRLFADSLHDNLCLGHPLSAEAVDEGIRLAAFDSDVAELPHGLSTPIGARGVRLSGGQAQRAAAARAMAHRPELLVLDDLTSALDGATELELWERLSVAGFTVLAASNRPIALDRADQVIDLGR